MLALLNNPRRNKDLDQVQRAFDAICAAELEKSERWASRSKNQESQGPRHSRELREIVSWTFSFHPNLLKELACLEAAQQEIGGEGWRRQMREEDDYYFPASARPAWTAWGVVLEVALRNMIATAQEISPDNQMIQGPLAVANPRPTVIFQLSSKRLPHALTIHFHGLEKRHAAPGIEAGVFRHAFWELGGMGPPWASEKEPVTSGSEMTKRRYPFSRVPRHAPPAEVVWKWALGEINNREEAQRWLNLPETDRADQAA